MIFIFLCVPNIEMSDYNPVILRRAISSRDIDKVKFYINEGWFDNIESTGITLLSVAILKEYYDIAQLIIDAGISINNRDIYGHTILHEISFNDNANINMIKFVLEKGFNANISLERDIVLTAFIRRKKYDIIKFLILYGII